MSDLTAERGVNTNMKGLSNNVLYACRHAACVRLLSLSPLMFKAVLPCNA